MQLMPLPGLLGWLPGNTEVSSREHGGGIMGGEGHPGLWEGPGSVLVGRVGGR